MATQWFQHNHMPQQYQHFQSHSQPSQYQNTQNFQQPQHQQPQQFLQNGQKVQSTPQQYQQLPQQYTQPQQCQHPGQYPQTSPQQYQQPPQQYLQSQQYQQQGQYYQGQQYPQSGQYPSAQIYQQVPPHPVQPQQQGYSGYQQQYPPQPYSSQQFPSHQYSSQPAVPQQQAAAQYGVHQQPYYQQVSPTDGQVSVGSTNHSCFNCGAPNHFAQNCPEPKRSVPAGALDPQKYANPLRRPKHGGSVVTKFSPLPPGSQYQGQSQGSPQAIPAHAGPSYQGAFTPTTPNSAQSPAQQQAWQQYWQHQAYQQNQQYQQQYQHHQPQQQGTSYQSQPYSAPANEAAISANTYEQPGQTASLAPQYESASQTYQPQFLQAQSTQVPAATMTDGGDRQGSPTDPAEMTVPNRSQRIGSSVSMHSHSTQKGLWQNQHAVEEPEEDDLASLDVPDLPKGLPQNNEGAYLPNTIVSPPITLIGMPLPANFVVADALYPIPPPAPEAEGRCQSKYLRGVTLESLCENIKASKHWKDYRDDTVFIARPDDSATVSIDEVFAQLRERYSHGEANDDSNGHARSQSRSISVKKDSVEMHSHIEKIERDIADMKEKLRKKALERGAQLSPPPSTAEGSPGWRQTTVKEEQITPPHSAKSEKVVNSAQETEDLLAALGVTGPPKPVSAANGAYKGGGGDTPFGWRVDSMQQQGEPQLNGSTAYSPGNGFPPRPPPPPPPPPGHTSAPDGIDRGRNPFGTVYVNGYAFNANGAEYDNGFNNTGPNGEILSPDDLHVDNPNNRKRSHNQRDSSSDEEDAPARRQEDDTTPKLKRRQPKVAAAYSRRW